MQWKLVMLTPPLECLHLFDDPIVHPYCRDDSDREAITMGLYSIFMVCGLNFFSRLLEGTGGTGRAYLDGQLATHLEYMGWVDADGLLKAAIHNALAAWLELRLCLSDEERHRGYRNPSVDWDEHTASVRDRLKLRVETLRRMQAKRRVPRAAAFERDVLGTLEEIPADTLFDLQETGEDWGPTDDIPQL